MLKQWTRIPLQNDYLENQGIRRFLLSVLTTHSFQLKTLPEWVKKLFSKFSQAKNANDRQIRMKTYDIHSTT